MVEVNTERRARFRSNKKGLPSSLFGTQDHEQSSIDMKEIELFLYSKDYYY
jgi:hypothetical protein